MNEFKNLVEENINNSKSKLMHSHIKKLIKNHLDSNSTNDLHFFANGVHFATLAPERTDNTPSFEKGRGPTIRMSNYEKMWNKLRSNTAPNAESDVLSRHVMNLAKHLNLHNTKLENLSHS
jgi:hypothetical protein